MSSPRRIGSLLSRLFRAAALGTVLTGVVVAPVMLAVRHAGNPTRFAVVVVLVALGLFIIAALLARLLPPLGRHIILELDLTRPVPEVAPSGPLGRLRARRPTVTVREVVEGLERAAKRKRVVGVVAVVGGGVQGLARIDEVRGAVRAFRESGKPAIAFSETFGELAQGTGSYYLATAFDEIVMQPSGDLGATGVMAAAPFLREALEKLGVEVQMDHRHEYKTALNMFTESAFTDAHREASTRIIESQFEAVVAGIAAARGIDEADARDRIDGGPYFGAEAVAAGLVDRLAYRDEVVDQIKERTGGELVAFGKWAKLTRRRTRGATIGLVYGTGPVVRGPSRFSMPGGASMGSDSVTKALRAAREDKRTKAVVFRVDSPGGSYVASDAIWRETAKFREAGKPLIVSMGNVAGSGGYFVAMGADRIVAQPATITGSIGVVGGKQVVTSALGKAGITFDSVQTGPRAGMYSSIQRYSDDEWQRVQDLLDRIYDDFTAKVALGRNLSRDAVGEIAKGRVWTGADAIEIGLVDALGGFDVAAAAARELAGLAPDAPIRFREFPRRRPLGIRGRDDDSGTFSLRGVTDDLASILGPMSASALRLPGWLDGSWWR